MEKFKFAALMIMFFACFACKKQADPASLEIVVQDVLITDVKASRVDITYKLSNLGYKETGVLYYKMDKPAEQRTVLAIRKDGQFMLSLQNLEPGTEYGFKVYYKTNDLEQKQEKEFLVKTLSAASIRFLMEVKGSEAVVHDGVFSIDVEGEHLNELNLSELAVAVNAEPATISYPVLISRNRYKMTISGKVRAEQAAYSIMVYYKEQEVLAHYIPPAIVGPRYWMSHKLSDLPAGNLSVFGNNLYLFREQKVLQWHTADQRFVPIASFDDGLVYPVMQTFSFDNQMFFPPAERNFFPDPKDPDNYKHYPAVVAFVPGSSKFTEFHFRDHEYGKEYLFYENSQYFVHKNQLFLAFTLVDYSGQYANRPTIRKNFIYRYNQQKKQFEFVNDLKTDILNFRFTSINNQMYLIGLLPVIDQGYKLSATFGVLKVSDTFERQEIYRSGTVSKPQSLKIRSISNAGDKILIISDVNAYKLFDPAALKLYDVYLKNNIPNDLNALFTYKNMLHLNTTSETYELALTKEP